MNNLGLGFVFTAKDLASGTMRGVNANLTKLAGSSQASMGLMGKAMAGGAMALGGMAAGLKGLGAAAGAAVAYGEFGTQLEGVRVIMRGTAEDTAKLEQAAIKAGMATQFSPDETIAGLRDMATMGLNVNDSIETLLPTLNLATASMGDLGVSGAAKAIVGTMKSFTSESLTAEGTADKLARVTQLTNFQMKDFEIGLSKAAAVAGTFGTSVDDTLIALGLLRNRNIDASSAATAFREAQRRVASDKRAQQGIEKAGVKLVDEQTGKMRSAISILLDFAAATDKMTVLERNRAVASAFGARGLIAFSAIADAQTKVMRDGTEVTLKGADAINALREEMVGAGGTVKTFADARMGTFEGQLVLVSGLIDTLRNRLGKTFAGVFKPAVEAFAGAVEWLVNAWEGIPDPIKKGIAVLFLAVSGFVAGSGAVGLLVAMVVLLLPVLKAVAVTFGVILVAMLPLIAGLALVAAAVYGLKLAWDRNLGGIQDRVLGFVNSIKLAWTAISEELGSGKISEATQKELDKAGNQGVAAFVDRVLNLVGNLRAFWDGFVEGLSAGIDRVQPAFDRFGAALDRLKAAFALVFTTQTPAEARAQWEQWGNAGATTGDQIAAALGWIVDGLVWVIDVITTVKSAFNGLGFAMEIPKASMGALTDSFSGFGAVLGVTSSDIDSTNGQMSLLHTTISVVGTVLGMLFTTWAVIWSAITNVTSGAIGQIRAIFGGLLDAIMMIGVFINAVVSGDWSRAWMAMKGIAFAAIRGMIGMMASAVGAIAGVIDALGKVVGKDFGAKAAVGKIAERMTKDFELVIGPGIGEFVDTRGGTAKREGMPAPTTVAPGAGRVQNPELNQLTAELARARAQRPGLATGLETQGPSVSDSVQKVGDTVGQKLDSAIAKIDSRPLSVRTTAELDGDVLYDKVAEVARSRGVTAFEPG